MGNKFVLICLFIDKSEEFIRKFKFKNVQIIVGLPIYNHTTHVPFVVVVELHKYLLTFK